jgi:hypothetical protein
MRARSRQLTVDHDLKRRQGTDFGGRRKWPCFYEFREMAAKWRSSVNSKGPDRHPRNASKYFPGSARERASPISQNDFRHYFNFITEKKQGRPLS